MLSNAETQQLVGSLVMLVVGVGAFLTTLLVRRGNAGARKWLGSSTKQYIHIGVFGTIAGLLNLGQLVVPDRFADTYATFFLASTILLVAGFIITMLRDRRAR